jgi:hypothetical protein
VSRGFFKDPSQQSEDHGVYQDRVFVHPRSKGNNEREMKDLRSNEGQTTCKNEFPGKVEIP